MAHGTSNLLDNDTRRKRLGLLLFIASLLIMGGLCYIIGKPMLQFVSQPESFRAWVNLHGIWGRAAFVGMMVLQILMAFIPGEPLELGAGYAFGTVEGTLLCLLGAVIGTAMVYLLVKKLGMPLLRLFFKEEQLARIPLPKGEKRLHALTFLVFLIPGSPKDILTYAIGLTKMRFADCLLITGVARIPSIVTSTMGGAALGTKQYVLAGIVLAVTLLLSGAGLLVFRRMSRKKVEEGQAEEKLRMDGTRR